MPHAHRRTPKRSPEPWSSRKRWLIAALLACVLAPVSAFVLLFLVMGLAHSTGWLAGLLSLLVPGVHVVQNLPNPWAGPVIVAVQWPICLLLCRWVVGWWDRRRTPVWARDWAKE